MTRTNRFVGGVGFGYANLALVTLAGLWLIPFFLNRIGQHNYGLWLVGTQVIAYLMLLDFGLIVLLPRETAYATGRAGSVDDAAELPKLIGETARLVLWQIPVVALATIILWFLMPAEWDALRGPLGWMMLAFVAMFPLRIFQAVLQGLQDLRFVGGVQICSWLVGTAITVVLVVAGLGLYSMAFGWVAAQVISATFCWYRLRSHFPNVVPIHLPTLSWFTARGHLARGFWVSVAHVAQVMLNGTDILIIGKLFGAAAVVPFVCTGKLIAVLANQPQALMQAAGPALSEMKVGESRQRIFQVCTALNQAMLMVSGAIVCLVLTVNQGFVGWWVGEEQYGGFALSALLLLSMLLRHWNTTAVYAIFCFGHERRISLTTLLDGVVTVVGSVIFVWLFGPIGAPIGSILGVCLVSLPANLSALARESETSVAIFVRSLWPWFWRLVILVVGAGVVARAWAPNTFLALAVTAASTVLIYSALMLPVALQSHLGIYLRPWMTPILMKLFGAPLAKNVDA